ncbi:MAG: signal peptidase I [Dehalococcoidia bacterium]
MPQSLRLAIAAIGIVAAGWVLWLLAAALFVFLPPVGHLDGVVVTGGSMSPAVPSGSVAVLRSVDPSQVKPGDIVTFSTGNGIRVTHRVVSISETANGPMMVTHGDANTRPDTNLTPVANVQGRVVLSVALAGYLAIFISSPGFLAFGAGLGLLFFAGLPVTSWFRRKDSPPERNSVEAS